MMHGLTTEQANQKLEEYGLNILPKPQLPNVFIIFFRQFLSPLIYILLAAAGVSLFLEEYNDAIFIFAVLIINATIGTVQEFSAQRAASGLEKIVPAFATVIRDGKSIKIEVQKVVPEDIVLLESGDKIPADIKLLKTNELLIDESLLTGESVAVKKNAEAKTADNVPLGDRLNMAFAGTMVSKGRGQGEVIATGLRTELGKIAKSIASGKIIKPPLLVRIEKFTLRISMVALAVIVILFAIARYQGGDLTEMFILAVALAVAAIPEGLPAAITVALAVGMRRMASNNVIIRKLLAVESLGSCTFIAADKTGTLTVNELTARKILLPDGTVLDITGAGTSLKGEIVPMKGKDHKEQSSRICLAGILTNEASSSRDGYEGDMVDIAFLVLGKKCGLDRKAIISKYPEISKIPYESENGFSASVHDFNGTPRVFIKGSPEKLAGMCNVDKDLIIKQTEALANLGYRVLALADGEDSDNLIFLGLVGMIDPLRSEAKKAVELCKHAGIEVAMITGDHPATAKAIAIDLGLCDDKCKVITGEDIKKATSKEELQNLIRKSKVFARIEPTQKQQIVGALMQLGHFVAVTGDGVNDAPALKHAHVGVAMGKRGTDVARESSDLIITDDDFASIVRGVHEGRVVYSNIRKVVFLLISTGAAEIILFILSMLAGLPMPLLAVQLLWLNLVTNGIQDVAFGFEPAEGDELSKPPRSPNEPIFDRLMILRVVISALIIGCVSFGVFYYLIQRGYEVESARNLTLLLMVLFENVHVFNSRSETRSIFKLPFFSNKFLLFSVIGAQAIHIAAMYIPGLNDVLEMQPVTFNEWVVLLGCAMTLLLAGEVQKYLTRKKI